MAIARDVERALVEAGGAQRGETVLVGVSGGLDSMVLLHATARAGAWLGLVVEAVHAHHGLRGEDADRDQQLVEATCRAWSVPCRAERLRVGVRGSPEDRARRARRRFLAEVAVARGARLVLLAHHADDQAETVLDRVLSGSGPGGLRAMRVSADLPEARPHRVRILRPLLDLPRADLRRYADARDVPFREDDTNRDPAFRRNRIRHRILPLLREAGYPGVDAALVRVAALCGDAADLQDAAAVDALHRVSRPWNGVLRSLFHPPPAPVILMDRPALRALPPGLGTPVLRAAIRHLDPARPPLPGHRTLRDLWRRVARPGGKVEPVRLRRRLWTIQDGAHVVFAVEPLELAPVPYPTLRLGRGQAGRLAHGAIEVSLCAEDHRAPPPRSEWIRLDAAAVTLPLRIRPARPADAVAAPGRTGEVPVARLLKARGIGALERRVTPVVLTAETERVLAVPGHVTATWATPRARDADVLALHIRTPAP